MKYTAVSVRQLERKGKPWQARAKYKDVYGKWKEVSKMLPEAKGKKEANRMAKEWLDKLNAEADLMPNAGKAKTVDEIYKEYLQHQLATGEIERSTYSNSNNRFVRLTDKEIAYLRQEQDNLLCKYYIYLKYYCSLANKAGTKQDFTAKQFLSAIGYSTKSQSQIDKISTYNNKLKKQGLILITPYKSLLRYFGYSRSNKGRTSGSRIIFTSEDHPPILMHKPHPRKELLEYQVKQLIDILEQEGLL